MYYYKAFQKWRAFVFISNPVNAYCYGFVGIRGNGSFVTFILTIENIFVYYRVNIYF